MMKRRQLIQAGAAVAVGAPAAIGWAQQTVTLKFHTFMAPTSTVFTRIHKPWMEKVEKDSNGRIKFEGYPAMQLGGTPPGLYDQVRDGVVDVMWTLPGYTAGRFPRTEVFELPFMIYNAETSSRAAWEFFQTHMTDEFKDTQVIAVHTHGPGALHSRDKPIRSASDLRGMKVRGPTRQATRLLAAAGATPVGMPLPQIPDALVKGVISACALPWEVIPSVRAPELVKHHSDFGPGALGLYTSTFVMAMNKAKYESLPADLKRVIDTNSGMEVSAWMGKVQDDLDPVVRKSVQDRGNTLHVFSESEAAEFRRLTAPVENEWVDEITKRGFDGKRLLESAKALIAKHNRKS